MAFSLFIFPDKDICLLELISSISEHQKGRLWDCSWI